MRQASDAAIANLAAHGPGKQAVVMYQLSGGGGQRVFASRVPGDSLVASGGGIRFADGTWRADGSVTAGSGSDVLIEIEPWVIGAGEFSEGDFGGLSPFDAFREREAGALSLRLSNARGAGGHPRMGRILATEPVVGAQLDVRVAFDGGTINDTVLLASFRVRRVVERSEEVILDCEAI